jgi:cell division protein FtsW (lipid II flippase)
MIPLVGGLRWMCSRSSGIAEGPAWAAVLLTGTLVELGLILQLRLYWHPNPNEKYFRDATLPVIGRFLARSLAPAVVIVALMAGTVVVIWMRRRKRIPRWVRRAVSWVGKIPAQRRFPAALAAIVVVGLGFLLPLAGRATNGSHLQFMGIQMSEFFRLAWIILTAALMAWFGDHLVRSRDLAGSLKERFHPGRKTERSNHPAKDGRRSGVAREGSSPSFTHVAWILRSPQVIMVVLFSLLVISIVAASVARSDYGTLVAPAAAVIAMLFTLARHHRERWLAAAGDKASAHDLFALRWPKLSALVGAALIPILFVVFSAFGKLRGQVWLNPWAFAWTVPCRPTSMGFADLPPNAELCLQNVADATQSRGAQMAKAQVIIDGGGLWGRGWEDIEAGILPARHTDFVYAALWSKLGGLSVLAVVGVTVLLGWMLSRLVTADPAARGARFAHLVAAGFGAAVAGQAVYVIAAITNLIPHSGVTAPFTSFGSESIVAFLLSFACVAALAAVVRGNAPTRQRPALIRTRWAIVMRTWLFAAMVAFAALAFIVGIAVPFGSRRPPSLAGGLQSEDVVRQLAMRSSATLQLQGQAAFTLDRRSLRWRQAPGGATTMADMAGLIRVDGTDEAGYVEETTPDLLMATMTRTWSDRLWDRPSGPVVDLTLDPTTQALAARLAQLETNSRRFPTGIVVEDPASGAILAAATSPEPEQTEPESDQQKSSINAWNRSHRHLVRRNGQAYEPVTEEGCASDPSCEEYIARWRAPVTEESRNRLYTYVGNSRSYDLPRTDIHRGMNRSFGLGSTFKVIVAAAYLHAGGSISDKIDSPPVLNRGSLPINNPYDGECPGTVNGQLTVGQALAVSCNTSFVLLAEQVGWPRISAMARSFGFKTTASGRRWPADSTLPRSSSGRQMASETLGGGRVAGTAWQMASVMATIANDGRRRTPHLIDAAESPGDQPDHQLVLSVDNAHALQKALGLTSDSGGTLSGIVDPGGPKIYGKTGTQVVDSGGVKVSARQYSLRYYWVIGYIHSTSGPVSFAIVTECRTTAEGRAHVRAIARALAYALSNE